jgi:hypothetical protein
MPALAHLIRNLIHNSMRSRKRLTNLSAPLRQAQMPPGKLEALLS